MSADSSDEDGFTLVEMLVALALLGLMTVFALSSLRTLGTVRLIEARIDGRSEVEAVQRHFQQVIADARAVFDSDAQGNQKISFAGTADSLEFVTVLDDRLQRGGLYRLHYGVERNNLLLHYAFHRPVAQQAPAESEILLNNVTSINFRYLGKLPTENVLHWFDTWKLEDQMPRAVEVAVRFPQGDTRAWKMMRIAVETGN
jgi:prepilin-type N-terminal cleavage/methylation domain-containing protein